jgi:hypothetical protein
MTVTQESKPEQKTETSPAGGLDDTFERCLSRRILEALYIRGLLSGEQQRRLPPLDQGQQP